MHGNTGVLLIAIGLIALYVVLSDKYGCFTQFIECLTGADMTTPEGYTPGSGLPGVDGDTGIPGNNPDYGYPTKTDTVFRLPGISRLPNLTIFN